MKRGAFHALDLRMKPLDDRRNRSLVAVNGVDRDAVTAGKRSSAPDSRGAGFRSSAQPNAHRGVLEQPSSSSVRNRVAVFGAELGDAIRHHVDDCARNKRQIEAAAQTDVQRQIVAARRQARANTRRPSPPCRRPWSARARRGPRRRTRRAGHAADARDRASRTSSAHLRICRGDNQNPHRLRYSTSSSAFGTT